METIIDNGMTFVKATALAKKYRYTTDYIGQLCRKDKVEAKLIGRAWFVNEDSLINHKSDRYSSNRSTEITINKSVVSDRDSHPVSVRREIRPVLAKATHRSFTQNQTPPVYNFIAHGAAKVSTYLTDESHLEPVPLNRIHKNDKLENEVEKPSKIKVILGERAAHTLTFEELPEVMLRGNLVIDSLDEPDLFADVEPVSIENIRFSPQSIVKPIVPITKQYQSKPVTEVLTDRQNYETVDTAAPVVKGGVSNLPRASHTVSVKREVVPKALTIHFVVVPVLLGVSLVAAVLLLGLAGSVETDGSQFNQSVTFSLASVIESVSKVAESY